MVVNVGLAGWIVAMTSLAYETLKTFYLENKSTRIMVAGAPGVGKSTFIYQMKNKVPIAPDIGSTRKMGTFNQVLRVDLDDKKRKVKTRDVPGEGFMTGEWWRLLLDLKPKGILFIVDDRLLKPEGIEQVNSFKLLISLITSKQYKNMVGKNNRVKLVLVAANKADIWRDKDGLSINELLQPLTEELMKLPDNDIAWNWTAMSAKYSEHINYALEWLIKAVESELII